jgi:hypothetical protein
MQFPSFFLDVAINVAIISMVFGIFALMCNDFFLLIFSPFHLFFPSLEASRFSFYFELLGFPLFWPIFPGNVPRDTPCPLSLA